LAEILLRLQEYFVTFCNKKCILNTDFQPGKTAKALGYEFLELTPSPSIEMKIFFRKIGLTTTESSR
jgi:hypothetical protein